MKKFLAYACIALCAISICLTTASTFFIFTTKTILSICGICSGVLGIATGFVASMFEKNNLDNAPLKDIEITSYSAPIQTKTNGIEKTQNLESNTKQNSTEITK